METRARWSRLAPPAGLAPRIRRAFLAADLILVTTFVVHAVATSSRPAPLRALCVVMLVLLAARWVRGYRRHTFPVWAVPLEMATFVVLVLVQDVVISVVTLAYFSVQLRSPYDGWPRTVLFGTSTALTFAAAARAVPVGGWTEGLPLPATTFASIPLIMVVIHLVALAGQQTERGGARERLVSQVREGDLVARTGGDELVVLVVGEAVTARAGDLAHRLLAAVGAPLDVAGHELRVGVSIGTAVHAGGSVQRLLQLSDRAMYQAKDAGRHRVVHLDAPQEPAAALT